MGIGACRVWYIVPAKTAINKNNNNKPKQAIFNHEKIYFVVRTMGERFYKKIYRY